MSVDISPELRSQVAGSSFYVGMAVLPKPRREAMFAIYAFCRAVDDIADDQQGERSARAAALEGWRRDIDALYAGGDGGQAAWLADPVRRFALERADFHAVIDGMMTDVEADVRWPVATDLDLYCDRVASAVGRLSVNVFGMARAPGVTLAHHLGRALQLTNILRDIDEDAAIGRVYLPREALVAAGVPLTTPLEVARDPRIEPVARALATQARDHYEAAHRILADNPEGHLIAPKLMEAAYKSVLQKMERVGWVPPRARVRVNKAALFWRLLVLLVAR